MPKGDESLSKVALSDPSQTLGGRLRSALLVIRAQAHAVTREDWIAMQQDLAQLRFEWLDYQEKINTWAGRAAKREQRELDRLASEDSAGEPELPVGVPTDADGFMPGLILPS